jgi:thiol-disulfide isomerase/thioredoxin
MNKRIIYFMVLVLTSIFILGCTQTEIQAQDSTSDSPQEKLQVDWMNIDLGDIRTGQTFKISDFEGKPILLESFAVWCPTCTAQQGNIKELHEEVGDAVVSISLNTDPNEDFKLVRDHIEENGFDWFYAISPVEVTKALIYQFGMGVVNAPSAPVVLICPDLSTRFLGRGLKSIDKLKEEIERGC